MFKDLKNKKIPLILLNARLTKKTFNRWMKIKSINKKIFNKITIAFPQNLETKFYLKKLNVKNINLIGNLKFAENKTDPVYGKRSFVYDFLSISPWTVYAKLVRRKNNGKNSIKHRGTKYSSFSSYWS